MGYYISNMIGIRTGGVFSGAIDWEDAKQRISIIIKELRKTNYNPDIQDDPTHCMSQELRAHKGNYVVLAGVFNYWNFRKASEFSKRISKEFTCEVMHMCWDEQTDEVQCQIFLDGRPLFEVKEYPIGKILRRIM